MEPTLLQKAITLYLGVKAAKPQNDPMFLGMREFITMHFGHEGTRAMVAADAEPVTFLYKKPGNQRPMKAFQHPLNTVKIEPEQVLVKTADVIKKPSDPKTTASDVLTKKSKAAKLGEQDDPHPGHTTGNPNLAVAGEEIETGDNDKNEGAEGIDDIDVVFAKTMKAKALGEKYSPETMTHWLNENGVETTGDESKTQLAKLVLLTIDQVGK